MHTDEIDHIIDRFLEQSATADEERALYRWAGECDANKRYLRERQKLHQLAHTFKDADAGTDAEWAKLMQLPVMKQGRSRKLYMMLTGAAAAAAVLFGVWIGIRHGAEAPDRLAQTETVRYQCVDSLHDYTLADGSVASLAAGSSIDAFAQAGSCRSVRLTGKAYFEVTHDTAHPFTVQAGKLRVTVLGTHFEVRENARGGVTVSVSEGKVRVEDTASGFAAVLVAMQQICVGCGKDPQVRALANENYLAWKTGRLQFADVPLAEALTDISDAYGISYVLQSPVLDSMRVNAAFDQRSRAQVEAVLQTMLGATFGQSDSAVYISKQQ